MDNRLIQEALNGLDLITIKLHSFFLDRDKAYIASEADDKGELQTRHVITAERLTFEAENDAEFDILRAFPTFGIRSIKEGDEVESQENFRLEATFRIDYRMKHNISKGAVEEFLKYNALHNVWPFWREFVFSTLNRAELPDLEVPLFRPIDGRSGEG